MGNSAKQPPTQGEPKTRTERSIDKVKRHPIVLIAGLLLALLVAISTAFGNIDTIITDFHKYFPSSTTEASTPISNSCTNSAGSHESTTPAPVRHTYCVYRAHKGQVNAVGWSPDGTHIVSAGQDGTVQVWNATTGDIVTTYRGHKGSINAVTWLPDGTRIASAGQDGTIQVWLSDSGRLVNEGRYISLYPYKTHTNVTTMAASPDGTYIAFTGGEDVTIFQTDLGDQDFFPLKIPKHKEEVNCIAWSPNSKELAIGYDSSIEIWNVSTFRPVRLLIHTPLIGGFGIPALAWSPDGNFIASAENAEEGNSGLVEMWRTTQAGNLSSRRVPIYFPYTAVEAVSWSCNNKYLALGAQRLGEVEVWNTVTNQHYLYEGHTDYISSVAWSPDGTRAASASKDGTVRIWQANNEKSCIA